MLPPSYSPPRQNPPKKLSLKRPNRPHLEQRIPQGLGLDQYAKIETFSRRLFAGDTVILYSGGLTDYMTEKEIARAITRHPLEQAVRRLLALGERTRQSRPRGYQYYPCLIQPCGITSTQTY